MEVQSLMRRLLQVSKISLTTYARVPCVTTGTRTLTIGANPVIFIRFNEKVEYGQPLPTDNAFRVNPRNHHRVTKFFREILDWFEDVKYQDLYILDEGSGHLLINMDYQDLRGMVRGSRYDAQVMLAQPAVYVHDSKEAPGAVLAINRTNYSVCLSDDDLSAIYGVISNFSFQQEALLLMTVATNPQCWLDQNIIPDVRFIPATDGGYSGAIQGRKITW